MKLPELKTQKYLTAYQLSACIYDQLINNQEYKEFTEEYRKDAYLNLSKDLNYDIWGTIRTHVFYDEVNNGEMLDCWEADEYKIKDLSNGSKEDKLSAVVLTLYNQLVKAVNESEPDGVGIFVYW